MTGMIEGFFGVSNLLLWDFFFLGGGEGGRKTWQVFVWGVA